MDLSAIPILDHHAHPLWRPEATGDAAGFRRWFTESTDPEVHARHAQETLFFRTAVRWLAELLDCRPALADVLAARAAQPYRAWVQRLFKEANISLVLCDYGYRGDLAYNQEEMAALLPCPVRPILRLETLAQELIVEQETFGDMVEAFVATVGQARAAGYVALKSIAAYRSGLAIGAPARAAAAAAFVPLKEEARRSGRVRLASKPLVDYLLGQAVEQAAGQGLPLQFHTGFGDRDADLRQANPLHLRALIERTQTPLVLLHAGWPFYREAAHLAALYSHVWLDVSLAIPLATAGIPTMLGDILGLAPFSKVMLATDAFTMPEIFWLAARWGRWGLGQVLERFVEEGFLSEAEAWG
ncbi:MAG: amidohydrolase family protein, partial [Chloroflexi bacterium]|nr:amidohydrolase family protein [Chloroflexota bacterium]